jgi:SEC-C motif-containing protein
MTCPCGSFLALSECCGPIIAGASAASAEAMMRARYSAYTQHNIDFIMASTHPEGRADSDIVAMRSWAETAQWQSLDVLRVEAGTGQDRKGLVEFKAHYHVGGVKHHHHEVSDFVNTDAGWQFRDGEVLHSGPSEKPKPVINELKIGRNDPCHCGNGKKFKKCHGA